MTSVPTEPQHDKADPHDRGAAYRDAWLDELWAPVREYRPTAGDRDAAEARRQQLATMFGDKLTHHDGDRVRWSGVA